jgi:hypothetical protein
MSNSKTETLTSQQIARAIDGGHKYPHQVEKGAAFAKDLHSALIGRGWDYYESHSYCKVASFESHLQKGHRRIEIISSAFMGVFTTIHTYEVERCSDCLEGTDG